MLPGPSQDQNSHSLCLLGSHEGSCPQLREACASLTASTLTRPSFTGPSLSPFLRPGGPFLSHLNPSLKWHLPYCSPARPGLGCSPHAQHPLAPPVVTGTQSVGLAGAVQGQLLVQTGCSGLELTLPGGRRCVERKEGGPRASPALPPCCWAGPSRRSLARGSLGRKEHMFSQASPPGPSQVA